MTTRRTSRSPRRGMTREDWNQVLATEPATDRQRGAVMREFARLGFGDDERAERLAACAAFLGLDGLGSTHDLTMGQAGQLVCLLRACASRADLPVPPATASPRPSRRTAVIAELAAAMYRSRSGPMTAP